MLRYAPTVNTIADVMHVSQPLTFANAPVCAIVYEHQWQPPQPRVITPRLLLEVHGVAYVIAHCHVSDAERTFRLDRIQQCWLEEGRG
jgi:predicted DNA-binding transcriptional regulator YafY